MANKDKRVGIKVDDSGTTKALTKEVDKLTKGFKSAKEIAESIKVGGSSTSKAMASANPTGSSALMSNVDYRIARGTSDLTAANARNFARESQGLGGLVRLYATYAANVFALTTAFNALSRAMDTTNMIAGLDALGASAGQNLGGISTRIVELTDGAISLREAMSAVAKGSAAGLTSVQLERLASVAKSSSIALGVDMTDAINRLSRGISKLEPELLDELGIFTKIGPAVANYAASIGKAESSITDFERRQAFANAVLTEGEKKFAAINDELSANPYNRLSAAMQNLSFQGLELINKVLAPIVELLSQSPMALLGVMGLLGAKILKQGGVAIGEYQNKLQRASEELTAFNAERLSNMTQVSARAAGLLSKHIDDAATLQNEAFERAEASFRRTIANTTQTFRQTNLTKLFDPSTAILDITEEQWTKAEKRLNDLRKMEKLSAEQSMELKAGEELFKTRTIEETYIKERKLEEDKFQRTLQNSKTYRNLTNSLEASRQKALQDQIAGNAIQNTQLFGIRNAWGLLRTEVASYGRELDKSSARWVYFKAGVGLATNAVMLLGSVINKAFFYLTIAVTVFEVFKAITFKATKETQEFNTAIEGSAAAVANVDRTIKTYEKSIGSLSQYTINGAIAMSNAFTELNVNIERAFDKFTVLQDKMSWAEKGWDWVKDFFNASTFDKVATSVADSIESALPLLDRAGIGDQYRMEWKSILGLDSLEEGLEDSIELVAKKTPEAIAKFIASWKKAQQELNKTSGAFDSLKNSAEAFVKAQNEFYQSTATRDPLFNLAESALKLGDDIQNAFDEGERGVSAFYDMIGKSPEVLGAFSQEVRQSIVGSFSTVKQLTDEVGKLQTELISLAKDAADYQKAIDKNVETVTSPAYSQYRSASPGPAQTGIQTKPLALTEEELAKMDKLAETNVKLANTNTLLASKQGELQKFSKVQAEAYESVITRARELIDAAVSNARTLASATIDKAVAALLTGEERAKVTAEATRKELSVRESQIRLSMQQTDAIVTLTETIAQLNAVEIERLDREKGNMGDEAAAARARNAEANRIASEEALNAFYSATEKGATRLGRNIGEAVIGSVSTLSERAQRVYNRLVEQSNLRTKQQQAQLAALAGERVSAELKILTDAAKGRTEDAVRNLNIEKDSIAIQSQQLDIAKQRNEISEREYIRQKLSVSEAEAINQFQREQIPLVEEILAIREAMARVPNRAPELAKEEDKLLADYFKNYANYLSRVNKAREDGANQELLLNRKIFAEQVQNALELRSQEITKAENLATLNAERFSMEAELLDFQVEKGVLTEQQAIAEKKKNDLAIARSEKLNTLEALRLSYARTAISLQLKLNEATSEQREGILTEADLARQSYEEQVAQEDALYNLKIQRIEQTAAIEYEKSYMALRSSIEDALLEGGKEGSRKLREVLEAEFRKPFNIVLKALMKPVVDIITSVSTSIVNSITGVSQQALGIGGGSSVGLGGTLSNLSNLYSVLKGGSAGMVGSLGSGISSVGSFLGSSSIAGFGQGVSLGAGFGSQAAMASALSEVGVTASAATSAGASLGSTLAAAGPYVAAAAALYAAYKAFSGGEKRSGSTYGFSASGNISESLKMLGGEALTGPGIIGSISSPSGGPIGGAEGEQRTKALFEATLGNINSLFEELGSPARIDQFWSKLEVSENNRGGVLVGGILSTGQTFGEVPTSSSSNYKGNLFEEYSSKSPDAETALKDFTLDLGQSMLQAVKAAADTLPEQISRLFKEDVDIELMSQEEVTAMIQLINSTRQLIKSAELLNIPVNLLSERMIEAAGGTEQFTSSLSSYYQNFYREEEQRAMAFEALTKDFEAIGLPIPKTREEFRSMAEELLNTAESSALAAKQLPEGMGPAKEALLQTSENAGEMYGKLISLNVAFASVVPATEELTTEVEDLVNSIPELISKVGLGVENFQEIVYSVMTGEIRAEDIGKTLASSLKQGVLKAISDSYTAQVSTIIVNNLITPVISSVVSGTSVAAALTSASFDAAIESMLAQASALSEVLNNPEIKQAFDKLFDSISTGLQGFSNIAVESGWTTTIASITDSLTNLYNSLQDLDAQLKTLKVNYEIRLLEEQIEELETQKKPYQDKIDLLNEDKKALLELNATYEEQKEPLQDYIKELEKSKKPYLEEINVLRESRRAIDDQIKALNRQKRPYQEQIEAIEELKDGIQDQIDVVNDRIELVNDEKNAINELLNAEKERNSALKDQVGQLESVVEKFKNFSESLKEFKDSLLLGNLSTDTPGQKYARAQQLLQSTYAKAASGDEEALRDIQKSASNFLDASREYYASSEQYSSDFASVQQMLDSLIGMTSGVVNEESTTLNSLKELLAASDSVISGYESSIKTMDTQIKTYQAEIEVFSKQLDTYSDSIELLNDQIKQIDKQIGVLDNQAELIDDQIDVIERQVESIDKVIYTVQDQIDAIDETIAGVDKQIASIDKLIAIENKAIDLINGQISTINETISGLRNVKESSDSLAAKIGDLELEIAKLTAELAKEEQRIYNEIFRQFVSIDEDLNEILTAEELKASGLANDTTLQSLILAMDINGDNQISRLEAMLKSSQAMQYSLQDVNVVLTSLRNDIPRALEQVASMVSSTMATTGSTSVSVGTAGPDTSAASEATYRAAVNALYGSIGVAEGQGVHLNSLVSQLLSEELTLGNLAEYFYSEVKKEMLANPDTAQHIQGYRAQAGLPPLAKGTNWLPSDMPIMAHEGERIIPKADNQMLISSMSSRNSTNEAMLQEIIKLNKKVEQLERTIAEGDVMNAQATERNTAQVSQAVKETATNAQFEQKLRRRTEVV